MNSRWISGLTVIVGTLVVSLATPPDSRGDWTWTWERYRAMRVPVAVVGASGCDTCTTPQVALRPTVALRPAYTPLFPGWGRPWFVAPAVTTVASPIVGGFGTSACDPCGSSCHTACRPVCHRVCRYVPQTCYRTEYCQQAVTVMRPVCECDPCTGCPRTVLRPTVCYQQVARRVPYTTYRPVWSTVCHRVPTCDPCCNPCCSTGNCAGGDCAGGCGITTQGAAPTTVERQPIKIEQQKPEIRIEQGEPSLPTGPGNAKLQQNDANSTGGGDVPYKSGSRQSPAPGDTPRIANPRDRVTSKPAPRVTYRHVAAASPAPQPAAAPRPRADDGGWRAASR